MIRRRLLIAGRVQGIWYRAWFEGQAKALGLVGWVRNRSDGNVEAVVEGSIDAVEAAIVLARHGSPASRVDDVTVLDEPRGEAITGFATRATV